MAQRRERVCKEGEERALEEFGLTKVKDLGSGSYGNVFLAVDSSRKKHAVKICVKPEESSDVMNKYLVRELDLHKILKHRNIVELYNGLSLPDCTILDMEFCDKSLTDFFKGDYNGVLPEPVFKVIARHITSAISFLHRNKIVHRDLKPDNVLMCIRRDGSFVAKLADFGFAKKEQEALVTSLGSPVYEAPEVMTSAGTECYTNRCDIWSLGVMYYQLLTGKYPFSITSRRAIKAAITDPNRVAFDIPEGVNASKCLRHFVRNHLILQAKLRYTAEEAMNHPFLMAGIHVLKMVDPVDSKNCTTRLSSDVEIGDLAFEQACRELGDKIDDPHSLMPLTDAKKLTVKWEDVAKRVNIDRRAMDDLCIVSSSGMFSVKDLVQQNVPDDEQDTMMALFISAKNGIRMEPTEPSVHHSVTEDEIRQVQVMDKSTLDALNAYLSMWSKYFKDCSSLIKERDCLYDNCVDVEIFRAIVNKFKVFDLVYGRVNGMQQELKKKRKDFPMVAFIPPMIDRSHRIDFDPVDCSVIPVIRKQLKDYRNKAQRKVDSQNMDVSPEVSAIADIWEKNKDLESKIQKDVSDAYSMLSVAVKSLCPEAEVFGRLFHYMCALEKAKVEDDPRVVYPELQRLARCDYLSISPDSHRGAARVSEPPVVPREGSDDRDAYIETLKAEIDKLQAMNDELKADRDKLAQEMDVIRAKAAEMIETKKAIIDTLRRELAKNHIQDPTTK